MAATPKYREPAFERARGNATVNRRKIGAHQQSSLGQGGPAQHEQLAVAESHACVTTDAVGQCAAAEWFGRIALPRTRGWVDFSCVAETSLAQHSTHQRIFSAYARPSIKWLQRIVSAQRHHGGKPPKGNEFDRIVFFLPSLRVRGRCCWVAFEKLSAGNADTWGPGTGGSDLDAHTEFHGFSRKKYLVKSTFSL